MAKVAKYKYDEKTLSYKMVVKSTHETRLEIVFLVLFAIASTIGYYFFYTRVLDKELPKTIMVRRQNMKERARYEELKKRVDNYESRLTYLRQRDNDTYRLLYGMEDSPAEVTIGRIDTLREIPGQAIFLKSLQMRLDAMLVNAYNQSRSFSAIKKEISKSGDLAAHIPAIPPMCPEAKAYRLTSRFGYRTDPVYGGRARHTGVDFAMKPNTPIYSVGDGFVEKIKFDKRGYGNHIVVNHGFGYKTRYGHLKAILVTEGQRVVRGEQIALSGNSGKSTGPHLHFEVIYRKDFVNPLNYMDLDMDVEGYGRMEINKKSDDKTTEFNLVKPQSVKKKKKKKK